MSTTIQPAKSGKLKQNFRMSERVRMARTTDPALDNQYGTILGIAAIHTECDFYIVGLDTPHPLTGYLALMLIESCIDRLSNHE